MELLLCNSTGVCCVGPLHGLANQEVLMWLTNVIEKVGPDATQDQLKDFLWETLKSGQVKGSHETSEYPVEGGHR